MSEEQSAESNGGSTGIRTQDTRLKRPLLYQAELWTPARHRKHELAQALRAGLHNSNYAAKPTL